MPPGGGRGMKFRKLFRQKTRKITPARYWAIKEAVLIIGFSFGIFLPKPSYFLRCVKTIVVATYIRPKILVLPRAGSRQQVCESLESIFSHVPQLLAVDLLDWFVQTIHKFEALRGDSCQHQSPVSAFARARNQAAFFHTVQEPRDIGVSGNHAASNLAASEPLRRSSQDAQDIVLSGGEILGLEHAKRPPCQHVSGAQ